MSGFAPKPLPPRPEHPIERLTVHRPVKKACHVHVYGPSYFFRGWTVHCACGRMPNFFSKDKRLYRTETDAVEAGRQHLAGGLYAD